MKDIDIYQDCIKRLEPDVTHMDQDATLTSIAISLKRIADVMEALNTQQVNEYGETILPAITRAIKNGLSNNS